MGFDPEVRFRIITEPEPGRSGQPTHCAEPLMWRYRLGAPNSTIRPAPRPATIAHPVRQWGLRAPRRR